MRHKYCILYIPDKNNIYHAWIPNTHTVYHGYQEQILCVMDILYINIVYPRYPTKALCIADTRDKYCQSISFRATCTMGTDPTIVYILLSELALCFRTPNDKKKSYTQVVSKIAVGILSCTSFMILQ